MSVSGVNSLDRPLGSRGPMLLLRMGEPHDSGVPPTVETARPVPDPAQRRAPPQPLAGIDIQHSGTPSDTGVLRVRSR